MDTQNPKNQAKTCGTFSCGEKDFQLTFQARITWPYLDTVEDPIFFLNKKESCFQFISLSFPNRFFTFSFKRESYGKPEPKLEGYQVPGDVKMIKQTFENGVFSLRFESESEKWFFFNISFGYENDPRLDKLNFLLTNLFSSSEEKGKACYYQVSKLKQDLNVSLTGIISEVSRNFLLQNNSFPNIAYNEPKDKYVMLTVDKTGPPIFTFFYKKKDTSSAAIEDFLSGICSEFYMCSVDQNKCPGPKNNFFVFCSDNSWDWFRIEFF